MNRIYSVRKHRAATVEQLWPGQYVMARRGNKELKPRRGSGVGRLQ